MLGSDDCFSTFLILLWSVYSCCSQSYLRNRARSAVHCHGTVIVMFPAPGASQPGDIFPPYFSLFLLECLPLHDGPVASGRGSCQPCVPWWDWGSAASTWGHPHLCPWAEPEPMAWPLKVAFYVRSCSWPPFLLQSKSWRDEQTKGGNPDWRDGGSAGESQASQAGEQ